MKRDMNHKLIAGVCAGLARDMGINPWIIRILFIIFAHALVGILIYIALWMLMPPDNLN